VSAHNPWILFLLWLVQTFPMLWGAQAW
jgi:hypothetical protein